MLTGRAVRLRGLTVADLPSIERWLGDPELWQLVHGAPFVPRSPLRAEERWLTESPDVVSFAVDTGTVLVGVATLHSIDPHNRSAELGLWFGDHAARGQGHGREALRLLIDYGFRLRGLHRLAIETLASNGAMRRLAEEAGFRLVGTLRENAWVDGAYADSVLYDRLAEDPSQPPS